MLQYAERNNKVIYTQIILNLVRADKRRLFNFQVILTRGYEFCKFYT